MITYSGRTVLPVVTSGAPSLYDIGVGLGRQPRFGGQTIHWYPVLAHVLTCARLLPGNTAVHGLLHDTPEAILANTPDTWKTPSAVGLEQELLTRIYADLQIPLPDEEVWNEVYKIDLEVRKAEAHVLGYDVSDEKWADPNPLIMDMTEGHLDICRSMLEPAVAGPIFEEAVNTYRSMVAA